MDVSDLLNVLILHKLSVRYYWLQLLCQFIYKIKLHTAQAKIASDINGWGKLED